MTNETRSGPGATEPGVHPFDPGLFFQASQDAMKSGMAMAANGPRQMTDAWLRLYAECLRFASHRLAAQAEFCQSLRGCEDAENFARAESTFLANAADEYTEELDRLADVARQPAAKPGRKGSGKAA